MACKFHAFMPFLPSFRPPRAQFLTALLAGLLALPAGAERADRIKPLNVEADQPGKIDLLNQFVVFNGNVVVTKGTMSIRAARIEVRETPEGYQTAVAVAAPGKLATFRQKRDGVDEYIEGEAERLEYDGKADIIKFINKASVCACVAPAWPMKSPATWSPTTARPRSSTFRAVPRRRRPAPAAGCVSC